MDTPLVREPNWFRVILEEASNRCILDAVVDTLNPEQVIKATALLRKLVAPKVRKPRIKRTCALCKAGNEPFYGYHYDVPGTLQAQQCTEGRGYPDRPQTCRRTHD